MSKINSNKELSHEQKASVTIFLESLSKMDENDFWGVISNESRGFIYGCAVSDSGEMIAAADIVSNRRSSIVSETVQKIISQLKDRLGPEYVDDYGLANHGRFEYDSDVRLNALILPKIKTQIHPIAKIQVIGRIIPLVFELESSSSAAWKVDILRL